MLISCASAVNPIVYELEAQILSVLLSYQPKLLPNKVYGKSWHGVSGLKKECRNSGRILALADGASEENKPKAYRIIFYPKDRRHPDSDNLTSSCKSYLDGVADAFESSDKDWIHLGTSFDYSKPEGKVGFIEVLFFN